MKSTSKEMLYKKLFSYFLLSELMSEGHMKSKIAPQQVFQEMYAKVESNHQFPSSATMGMIGWNL
jgi:hypothetical protein